MTNKELQKIALRQSAIDLGCDAADFLTDRNKVVLSSCHQAARKYLELPFDCNLVSYGSNIVASVSPALVNPVKQYIDRCSPPHCFETPNLHVLNDALAPHDLKICFMAEYFLPDLRHFQVLSCPYEIKLLEPPDFSELYTDQWRNALCRKRRQLDMLCAGAFDGDALIGLAGASADCDTMWQIGIDVLPAYRQKGIASTLTSLLANEILKRGKVPFYCAAWSNIPSVRNAIRSGFRPTWVELTAKSSAFVEGMNRL